MTQCHQDQQSAAVCTELPYVLFPRDRPRLMSAALLLPARFPFSLGFAHEIAILAQPAGGRTTRQLHRHDHLVAACCTSLWRQLSCYERDKLYRFSGDCLTVFRCQTRGPAATSGPVSTLQVRIARWVLMQFADEFAFLFSEFAGSPASALNPSQSRSLLGHAVASCLSQSDCGIARPRSTADTSDAALLSWRPKINMLGRVAHESVMRPAAGVQRTARLPCAPTPRSDVLFLPCWCPINFRRTTGGHASVDRCELTVLVSMRQVSPPALVVGLSAIQSVAQPARSVIVRPYRARECNGRSYTRRCLFCVWPMTMLRPSLNSAVLLQVGTWPVARAAAAEVSSPPASIPSLTGHMTDEERAEYAHSIGYRQIGKDLPRGTTLQQVISTMPKEARVSAGTL